MPPQNESRQPRCPTMIPLQERVVGGHELSRGEIECACAALLDESLDVGVRAEFLLALRNKGETPAEIAAFVEVLLSRATALPFSGEGCLDVCGTGGDRAGLFNVSTAVMFVTAACGARVVKHGNRSVTSQSGGADVLEALGVRIDLPPEKSAAALESSGCCFLFAPLYHPAFRAVAPVRKFLAANGRTSLFNILGPLLNPARPSFQLSGVFDQKLLTAYPEVFRMLGRRRAWAVQGRGPDGLRLDEASPLGQTDVSALEDGEVRQFTIHPGELGIGPINPDELTGGDAACNAGIISNILVGNLRNGARAIVQLNAAAALVVAGIQPTMPSAWTRAGTALDDGSARDVLDRLRACR